MDIYIERNIYIILCNAVINFSNEDKQNTNIYTWSRIYKLHVYKLKTIYKHKSLTFNHKFP